jgi:hypothetical protein
MNLGEGYEQSNSLRIFGHPVRCWRTSMHSSTVSMNLECSYQNNIVVLL